MGTLKEVVIKNISILIPVISLVLTLVVSVVAFDTRYAKSKTVDRLLESQTHAHHQSETDHKRLVDAIRLKQLEDHLFELRLQSKLSPAEQALVRRYEREVEEINVRRMRCLETAETHCY